MSRRLVPARQARRAVPEPTTRSGREAYAPPALVDVPPDLQFAELPSWIGDVIGRRVVRRQAAPPVHADRKPLGQSGHVIAKPGTQAIVMPMPDQPEVFMVAFMPAGTAVGAIPVTIPGMVAAVINSIIKLVPHKDKLEADSKKAADDIEAASGILRAPYGCGGRPCSCGR